MTADVLDIGIVVLILLSTIVGLVMGFIKEFLTLAALLAAFALAVVYAEALTPEIPFARDSELMRWGIAFAIIFISSLIIGLIVSGLLSAAVDRLGMGGFDHVLGTIFGFVLGVMVVTSVVLVLSPSSLSAQAAWQDSRLMPYFEESAAWVKNAIPDDWNNYVNQYVNKSSHI